MAITSADAAKVFGAAILTHTRRQNTFVNMLTGAAPKAVAADKNKNKGQTEAGAPVVVINDLSKQAGDTVQLDLIHNLNGLPVMGDKKIEGRGESLSKVEFDISINQGRHNVDSGGKMAQQRTVQNLLQVARTMLGSYFNDLQDEIGTYHLAGARGDFAPNDMIVPTESHSEFKEIMVNDITAPTHDRHFFGGDATSFAAIDATDKLTLAKIDEVALYIEEMSHPIKPIKFEADALYGESPFYVLFVTPRQWNDLWADARAAGKLNEIMANAMNRSTGFKHPLFQGDRLMWRNILVRKYSKPVRFNAGSTVKLGSAKGDGTEIDDTASTVIDRAILLGAQALGVAFGKSSSGAQFAMTTKKVDHDNGRETSISWMSGCKKIRYEDKSGRINDFGSMALDTAIGGISK